MKSEGKMKGNLSNSRDEIQKGRVLVVDDEAHMREVLSGLLEAAGHQPFTAENGMEALQMLGTHPIDVMLADIAMPQMSGLTLLRESTRRFPDVPVVLLTGQPSVEAAVNAMRLGARDFLIKPSNSREIVGVIEQQLRLRRFWQGLRQRGGDLDSIQPYLAQVNLLAGMEEGQVDTVLRALANVLDARERETQSHSERVSVYAEFLARRFFDSEVELRDVRRGALLHDVGKIGIPDSILLKPGPLMPEERKEMERHPVIGYEIIRGIDYLRTAGDIVLHHHERYDGKGYPHGLRGEEIPLGARIFAVVDTFDAMMSDRVYRSALPFSDVRAEILRCSGTQFDPRMVSYFASIPKETWLHLVAQSCSSVRKHQRAEAGPAADGEPAPASALLM